jgi:hypothetical protein
VGQQMKKQELILKKNRFEDLKYFMKMNPVAYQTTGIMA